MDASTRSPQRGQASAELVAVVPLILFAALVLAQAVVAGWALMSAGEAARSAARAEHVGADPEAAAREALPRLLEPAEVTTGDERVEVQVEAPVLVPGAGGFSVRASTALEPAAGS